MACLPMRVKVQLCCFSFSIIVRTIFKVHSLLLFSSPSVITVTSTLSASEVCAFSFDIAMPIAS